jgi:hypothetical protein
MPGISNRIISFVNFYNWLKILVIVVNLSFCETGPRCLFCNHHRMWKYVVEPFYLMICLVLCFLWYWFCGLYSLFLVVILIDYKIINLYRLLIVSVQTTHAIWVHWRGHAPENEFLYWASEMVSIPEAGGQMATSSGHILHIRVRRTVV